MKIYSLIFAIVFFFSLLFALPFHSFKSADFALAGMALGASGRVVLLGNSVNRTISKCDVDQRTLPQMLGDNGMSVSNFSRGGMQTGEMLYFASLLSRAHILPRTVILPVSPEAGFFRSVKAPLGIDAFFEDAFLRDGGEKYEAPTKFEGVTYGRYSDFAKSNFVREKAGVNCAGTYWVDRNFVRFMYWRNFLQKSDPLEGVDEFFRKVDDLRIQGVSVVVWITPVNYDDLRDLFGDIGVNKVKADLYKVRSALSEHGYDLIDTSELVGGDGFADRWCACGHLAEKGRHLVTKKFHDSLKE